MSTPANDPAAGADQAPPLPPDISGEPATPGAETPGAATPGAEGTDTEAPDAKASGTRFVFIDTEATGLDHTRHELTEVAWIVRFEDGTEAERQFFPQHTTDGADEEALELTHYASRIAPQPKTPMSEWLTLFLEDAAGAVIVGAVPDFDVRHLALACRKLGVEPTWDHHLLDVETLALPLIAAGPESPRSLAKTCAALGLPHDKDQAHGALYDAQQAKAVFDRVFEITADLRERQAPLPPPVPRRAAVDADAGAADGGATDDPVAEGDLLQPPATTGPPST